MLHATFHADTYLHTTADYACAQGETALCPAAVKGRGDMVVLLLANGADVDSSFKDDTNTAVSTQACSAQSSNAIASPLLPSTITYS